MTIILSQNYISRSKRRYGLSERFFLFAGTRERTKSLGHAFFNCTTTCYELSRRENRQEHVEKFISVRTRSERGRRRA